MVKPLEEHFIFVSGRQFHVQKAVRLLRRGVVKVQQSFLIIHRADLLNEGLSPGSSVADKQRAQ